MSAAKPQAAPCVARTPAVMPAMPRSFWFFASILPIGLALTLIIQGFVSVRVGIMEAKNQKDLGSAGITAGVLATQGAAWGFAAGIIMVAPSEDPQDCAQTLRSRCRHL